MNIFACSVADTWQQSVTFVYRVSGFGRVYDICRQKAGRFAAETGRLFGADMEDFAAEAGRIGFERNKCR